MSLGTVYSLPSALDKGLWLFSLPGRFKPEGIALGTCQMISRVGFRPSLDAVETENPRVHIRSRTALSMQSSAIPNFLMLLSPFIEFQFSVRHKTLQC